MTTVYLLHFHRPYQHAQHYIGYTAGDLSERVARHRAGNGANLVKVAMSAGIRVSLARAWHNAPRKFELVLKRKGSAKHICPHCNLFAIRRARLP